MKYLLKYKLVSNRDVFHSYSIDEEEWNKARLLDKDTFIFCKHNHVQLLINCFEAV